MDSINLRNALNFYKGKKVLVTGHTGFKGSWLTLLLHKLGAEIRGYSLTPHTTPNHFDLIGIEKDIESTIGDIKDINKLSSIIKEFKPEIVFHLAAQAIVKKSYENPILTFNTNTIGTANLLEVVKESSSIKSLVCITSDKCYENYEWTWGYRENDILGGHDPYSASKAAAEIIFSSYQKSFFSNFRSIGVATARAGNVIGGGDWSDYRLIPDLIKAIQSNEPVKIRNPSSTRPWQHVLEPLSGYILLGASLVRDPKFFSGAWNFGPSNLDVLSVEEVIKIIISNLGKGEMTIEDSKDNEHEANLLQLNCDKAIQNLSWKPRWAAVKALESTAEWFKVYLESGNIRQKSEGQIDEFFKELK